MEVHIAHYVNCYVIAGSYSSYGSHSSSSCGAGGRAMHERSHSDTPTPLPSVALSAESSSVTSLSNLPLRKTLTSGKQVFEKCIVVVSFP